MPPKKSKKKSKKNKSGDHYNEMNKDRLIKAAFAQSKELNFQFMGKTFTIPKVLDDRYIVENFLGCGGQGAIFEGQDTMRQMSAIIIKIIPEARKKEQNLEVAILKSLT
jgi:hypothetical protein